MNQDRRTTIGVLGGLLALALPGAAAAQQAVSDALLARKPRGVKLKAFELADGALLLIEDGRPFRIELAAAPDGRYDLSRSGTVVVENSRAAKIIGEDGIKAGAVMAPIGVA
jgi:PAS domain-containing protein